MERSALRRWLPALALALGLLVTSLVPLPQNGGEVPTLLGVALDKWVHAAGYGTFTVALASGRRAGTRGTVAVVVIFAIAYGAGIEALQGLLASRSTSGADVLANGVGAVVAGAGWHWSRRSKRD
ncbi:VanZ family protein [Halomicroarcula sp. GCM10025817]|uniref:VanZ family protein n=1 Tax=Haloarcula TaxID=2237 RepID=UPI0023E7B254|nr:VanZ family protein [Halomicroarcula sp. SYNS111]